MKNFNEIDENFYKKLPRGILDNVTFYDVTDEPFRIYGVFHDEVFRRLPKKLAESISPRVYELHKNTAGGRVRFMTDSTKVFIDCKMESVTHLDHMPLSATSGFDIIVDGISKAGIIPDGEATNGFIGLKKFSDTKEMHEIEINFPLYNDVMALSVGLDSDAKLTEAPKYKYDDLPIVFYGSSITQGCSVSLPSLAYPSLTAKYFGMNHINLGFSGNAKGETAMAEYIAGLPMKIFVLDYDHNSSGPEHLLQTHERFYKIVREKNPTLPIIITTAPDINFRFGNDLALWKSRRDVIYRTYENAVSHGDRNVYFIDGSDFFGKDDWWWCSVDGANLNDIGTYRGGHPNEIGHYRMSRTYIELIKKILG